MNRRSTWVCCAGWLTALVACTGGETGNPPNALESFDTSGCKSELLPKGISEQSLDSAGADPRYQGLNCFVWERLDERTLRIEITNHVDGCGMDQGWKPQARLNGAGELELHLDVPGCVFAGCFSCVYDLSFHVQLSEGQGDLPVKLLGDTCSGPAPLEGQAVLALSASRRGEVCAYAESANSSNDCATGESGGTRFGRCTKTGFECLSEGDSCQPGLTCAVLGADEKRCLPACQSDADCAGFSSTHCEQGTCRL